MKLPAPSPETRRDLQRGRFNIPFFASRFLGIEGNPDQIRFWEACSLRDNAGWLPLYLTLVASAGNRAGKTLAIMVVVLHHAFYKMGLRPPNLRDPKDCERWLREPYEWYHVGIQQEIAEIVHREAVSTLRGEHPAQKGRGCPLIKELGPIVDMFTKDRGEYLMLSFHPLVGGARIHFRSTQDKAKALLGKDMNGISFDEAGFEPYLTKLYQEVFNLRRMSTGGPLIFIGTPDSGLGEYYDLWELGNPENPNRNPQFISFKLSTRANIGFGLTQQGFDDVVAQTDPYLIPQNIDGEFIEAPESYFGSPSVEAAFVEGLPEEAKPLSNHRYAQGVDPGIAADASWALTLDFTDSKSFVGVRARRSQGRQSLPAVVNMVREGHLLFSSPLSESDLHPPRCTTIIDSTGLGGKMFKQEFSIIQPLREFDFAGEKSKKLKLLSDLKSVLDKGMLKLPKEGRFWQELRRQLLSYRLDDRKITQDAVMALAIAVYHAVRNSGDVTAPAEFRFFGGQHGSIR